jgi:polysaccharide chain length determinant protein (PEP-CTERM system associated)
MNLSEGIQPKDIGAMLRRRAAPAAALAGAVFLLSVVVAALLPNEYEAWTTLLVSPQTVSKKLVEPGVEDSELNQRLHLMTMQILSRGRLSKIIDDLGLYPEESEEMTREEVIELMRDQIRVEPVYPELEGGRRRAQEQEINTFRLFYRSHSPQLAAGVADRLANDFIDEHIRERVDVTTGTSEFIEAELERLAGEIRQVEQRIATVKNENTGSLPEDVDANQRLLERAVSDLRFAQRDLAIAESDAAFYRQQAATGATDRARSYSDPDTPLERKQRLEINLGEARARGWTDKHPEVIALREEIATLETTVQSRSSGMEEEVSPEQQLANNEAKRAALRAQSAQAEIGRLQAQVDDVEARLAKTPQVAEQLAALDRQHEHLYGSFQDFSAKRLEAGVSANMERRQKGEQFRILEAAFAPPEPTSPNRLMIVLLGLALGLAGAAGTVLLLEVADTSLHGPRDLQAAFQLPVLAAIPRVLLESDRVARRRRRVLAGALAAGLTAVVLAGAGAGYWIVNGGAGGATAEAQPAAAPAARAGQG